MDDASPTSDARALALLSALARRALETAVTSCSYCRAVLHVGHDGDWYDANDGYTCPETHAPHDPQMDFSHELERVLELVAACGPRTREPLEAFDVLEQDWVGTDQELLHAATTL